MIRIEYFIIGTVVVRFKVEDKRGIHDKYFSCRIGQFHRDKDLLVAICDDSKYFRENIFPFYMIYIRMSDTENNLYNYDGEVQPTNDMQKEVVGMIKKGIMAKDLLREY